ncbi:replication-relaxation family protein [Mycolicibacterium neoaurum]|uniref:replication-relaxation family protein n=1 Tax=Mycolicibacterium neoaurum TaxID=1795 RepID=UPI001F4CEB58|nr:replication-relaxation family protein [Mycolicibacterium neoaurum]
MQLIARDVEILKLVGRFGQLTTPQVRSLVFPHQRSRTPCDHALHRLVKADLLALVDQRHPGGPRGGSSYNTYQLGSQGWALFMSGRYKKARVIRAHQLAIADVYVSLLEAERAGDLKIFHYATEPDSHIQVGGAFLKPDLYIDVGINAIGKRRAFWLEIDLGTERQKQVMDQVSAYQTAYEASSEYPLKLYPHSTIFLATDEARATEIRYWLQRAGAIPGGLSVQVGTIDEVLSILRTE